ncbi:MAG: 50S ribosomal protein L10, partial [Anaerolineales bacterium]
MAKSKEQKETMLAQYVEWVGKSHAVVLVEYSGLKMSNLDAIRYKVREAGGEFHI